MQDYSSASCIWSSKVHDFNDLVECNDNAYDGVGNWWQSCSEPASDEANKKRHHRSENHLKHLVVQLPNRKEGFYEPETGTFAGSPIAFTNAQWGATQRYKSWLGKWRDCHKGSLSLQPSKHRCKLTRLSHEDGERPSKC